MSDNLNNVPKKEDLINEIRQVRESIACVLDKIELFQANHLQTNAVSTTPAQPLNQAVPTPVKAEPVQENPKQKAEYKRPKMKVWKLVSGILSIVLSLLIVGQSFLAGIFNALSENDEISGTAGLLVAILMLTAGIVSIVVRNSEKNGGNVALLVLFGIAAVVGFALAGSYRDLRVWAGWCTLCALLAIICMKKRPVK